MVVINDNIFLERKKGKAFMDHKTRCQILAGLSGVDYIVPFTPSCLHDNTVCESITRLRPTFFIKDGDRFDASTIPEWNASWRDGAGFERRTRVITGVGQNKLWSSSNFLREWADFSICNAIDFESKHDA